MSDMAVEVLKQQFADLTRDYTGACEAIRQLEANVAELRGALAADDSRLRAAEERVWPGMTHGCDAPDWLADELLWTRTQLAEARAEVERTNHVMRLERMARQDSEDRLKADLAAAEAAREAVLASLAAAEAVAGEVREACVRSLNGMQRLYLGSNHVFVAKVLSDAKNAIHSVPLPTPSAALQRVREQAQRAGAERALRYMYERQYPLYPDGAPHFGIDREDWEKGWGACKSVGLAALFPTPDAGGPA